MKMLTSTMLAACLVVFAAARLQAETVTVKKSHICCGACVKAVNTTLGKVDGVSKSNADQNSKTITFEATDEAAAKKGIEALAKAGFHGTATYGDKAIDFPKVDAKEGATADKITFTGVHLCCGNCVKGAKEALQDVKNVKVIDVDQKTKTVTLSGSGIDIIEAAKAFNGGGFHGNLKK